MKPQKIEKFIDPDEDYEARQYYFRYVDRLHTSGGLDVNGDYSFGSSYVKLHLYAFQIVRKTPKGAIIFTGESNNLERFIADFWVRKFAYPTLKEAQVSFLKRKMNQCYIYEDRLHTARDAYQLGCKEFGMEDKMPKPASEQEVYDLIPRSMAQEMNDEIPI